MTDQPPSMADEVAKVISTTQAGVTLVVALGLTALSRRIWSWFSRSPDETFLIALTTHAAALERAKALRQPPEGVEDRINAEIQQIADELTKQANHNIRAAIVQRRWSRTRWAGVGPVGFALGVFAILFALSQTSTTTPQPDIWVWVEVAGVVIAFFSVIIGLVMKEVWKCMKMKELKNLV